MKRPSPQASSIRDLRRRRLRAGTESHYQDPAYYDHAYRRRRADVRFYVAQARRFGGPVLELGVGTARVAAALAEAGFEVVGIDRMASMLAGARNNLARLDASVRGRVTLRRADMSRLHLSRRFPLVIAPFNAFMHLYDRQALERVLASVRGHLEPAGRLVFDVLMPDLKALARPWGRMYRTRPFRHPADGRRYAYAETFQYDPVAQIQFVSMCFDPEGAPQDAFVTPLAHRQFFPAELEALLHYNGFAIETRYGSFDGGSLEADSESQIIVAKLRRATPRAPTPR
jgi:SAM-dependent methyltransferase